MCRAAEEAHIRAQVVQALSRDEFVARAICSEDLDRDSGLVEVIADLQCFGRNDVALEAAVSRLQPGAQRQLGHLERHRDDGPLAADEE